MSETVIKIKENLTDSKILDSDSESEEYVLKPVPKPIPKPVPKPVPKPIQETITVQEALNEYFRLKEQFEKQIDVNKKKIINNKNLSKREKRVEYLKLMPKCINCKRPSKKGTLFSITYHPESDKIDSYRTFKCSCGNLPDPCNLDIEIDVSKTEELDQLLRDIMTDIFNAKKLIINDKNKLLFGLITTEKALSNFDSNKTYISEVTSVYENYLSLWNQKVDNHEKKQELEENLTLSYQAINSIKDCIKKMNETNEIKYAEDAANIYSKTLEPLLTKIRHLKYKTSMVHNDDDNNCILIQRQYNIDDIAFGYANIDRVKKFDVGFKAKKGKKNKELVIIDTNKIEENIMKPKIIKELIDEPIIGKGKDGISWNVPEYQELWNRLPEGLKNEFKSNIDWMKDFMKKCVNERKNHGPDWGGCRLTTPPNLIIPPREMANGEYDFGVSIYNKVFNGTPVPGSNGIKVDPSTKQTLLTLYKEDPITKIKDYSMLEEAMNRYVEQYLNFGKGFF